jgi:hypothetical protein
MRNDAVKLYVGHPALALAQSPPRRFEMLHGRCTSAARLALLTLIVLGLGHGTAWAQGVVGTSWAVPGELAGKVQRAGKFKDPAPFNVLAFGPQGLLAANEFMLTLDDGSDPIAIAGTYTLNRKGKPLLTPDASSLASEVEELLEQDPDIPPGDLSVVCAKLKTKARVSTRKGLQTMKVWLKARCVATSTSMGVAVKLSLRLRKAQGPRIP